MPNWRDNLPDEIKGDPSLANFNDETAMAQGYIELKKMQGSSIRIPGEDAGEEAVTAFNEKLLEKVPGLMLKPDLENPEQSDTFYKSIGMPATAEAYATPELKDAPEGFELPVSKVEAVKKMAFDAKLPARQFDVIINQMLKQDMDNFTERKGKMSENQSAIKENWGMAYDDNVTKVSSLIDKLDAPDDLKASVKNGTATKETMNWLLGLTAKFTGEGGVPDVEGKINGALSPEEARAKIAEINGNKEHAYWVGVGQDKQDAIKRMVQLQTWANPGMPTEF